MSTDNSASHLDCIAVGAHPDDVEIACGGTLAALVKQGYRVGIVDLTDGEPTPNSPGPETRLAESVAAAKELGVQVRVHLELPNRRLFDSFESRIALAKVFRKYRPKLVIGLGDKTPLASPDHYQAMQITDAAIFYSRLSKWDEHFDGMLVHPVPSYLYYTLSFGAMPPPPGLSPIVVDISDTLEEKLKSIQCYVTQFGHRLSIIDRVRAYAIHQGNAAGYSYGEMLFSPKMLGTKDLIGFLGS